MKPDTVITLGDFEFRSFEVPEKLPFGGEQLAATHQLIGGVRIIDTMGRSDAPIAWSGIFLGEGALTRARYLDSLRIAGKPLKLTWSQFSFTVIVQRFTAEFERFYQVPYNILCDVVADLASPVTTQDVADLDDQMASDMNKASGLGGLIGNGTLTTLLADLKTAVAKVQSFVAATKAEIAAAIAPLIATQQQVQMLIASVSPIVDEVVSLGGVIPFAPFGQAAQKLQQQIEGFGQLGSLYELQGYLGRMSTNLAADGVSGRIMTAAGGDLYHLAAQQYGDATAWTTIARANALTDPVLNGVQTLTVPPTPDGTDGILTV